MGKGTSAKKNSQPEKSTRRPEVSSGEFSALLCSKGEKKDADDLSVRSRFSQTWTSKPPEKKNTEEKGWLFAGTASRGRPDCRFTRRLRRAQKKTLGRDNKVRSGKDSVISTALDGIK